MKVKLKIEFNHHHVNEHLTVDDLDVATRYALDVTRRLVDSGRKYVAVSLFVENDSLAYAIFKKKDVFNLKKDKTILTKKELEILKILINFYNESHYENADFYNVFDIKTSIKASSVVASLIKKGVVTMSTCPGCFNPLYPGVNFMSVVKDYDLDVDKKTIDYWNFVFWKKGRSMQELKASEQIKLAKEYGINGIVLLIANAIDNAIENPKHGEEESFEKLKEFVSEEDNFNKLVDLAERTWLKIDIENADGFIENIVDSIRKLLFVCNIPIDNIFVRDVIWKLEL